MPAIHSHLLNYSRAIHESGFDSGDKNIHETLLKYNAHSFCKTSSITHTSLLTQKASEKCVIRVILATVPQLISKIFYAGLTPASFC